MNKARNDVLEEVKEEIETKRKKETTEKSYETSTGGISNFDGGAHHFNDGLDTALAIVETTIKDVRNDALDEVKGKVALQKEPTTEYVLVPVAWFQRLEELANKERSLSSLLKGYLESASVVLTSSKRISEEKYYSL